MSEKLWGGRFSEKAATEAEGFTSSLAFDRRLAAYDLAGSRAHVSMLGSQGIIASEEAQAILAGLGEIEGEILDGTFPYRREFEDIHLNIEQRLTEKIGPVAGKLHTARSRNDQVALDEHLFVREAFRELEGAVSSLQGVLLERAEAHFGLIWPGYTHLQRAQPILLSHHLLAYFEMLERDRERLAQARRRADFSPLGAAALAGTTFPIDRERVAAELGFRGIYRNSLDAVSDRDYFLDFLTAAAILMGHLSRMAEEVVLWSSQEFGFLELSDAYATGSSIMPQKKNPDTAELVRGKTGRVYGNLLALLTVVKGLPLAYGSDLQEDKERVFDTFDTVLASLRVLAGIWRTLKLRPERVRRALDEDFSLATDLADYLARRGLPFREAHGVVGRLVGKLLAEDRRLTAVTLAELRELSGLFDGEALELLKLETSVASRDSLGGTAPSRVREALREARRRWLHNN